VLRSAQSRAPGLAGGGRGLGQPRRQRWLPGYEGSDADIGHHVGRAGALDARWGRTDSRERGGCIRVVAQTVWRLPAGEAPWGGRRLQPDTEFVAL